MAGNRGVIEDQIGSGRIGGGGSIWAPVGSCISFPCVFHPTPTQECCLAPTATISKPPPQEPEETVPEVPTPAVEEVELAPESPSHAVAPALEVTIPTHMGPLCLQLGASRGCINAR